MARRVRFSGRRLSLEGIARHHRDLQEALRLYYRPGHDGFESRFLGYSAADIARDLAACLGEVDVASSFSVIAMLEAAFRIDYLQRNYQKRRDPISRDFRKLHKGRGSKASLEDEILDVWRAHTRQRRLIGDLRGALNFRHWVAHGRYWQPKLGRAYDFATIHVLAEAALAAFQLENAT